jgi:molecular chaperone GrpE
MSEAEQPVTEEAAAEEAAAPEVLEAEPEPDPSGKAEQYLALAQRTQADFENFRKRMARESAAAVDRGVEKLARELLPALDHLELALQAAEAHEAGEWTAGIRSIQGELLGALGRVGIQPFSPAGEPFDPNEHEAMAQQPSEEAEAGTVLQVYQQGYRLNGQVLRPARVVVAGGGAD